MSKEGKLRMNEKLSLNSLILRFCCFLLELKFFGLSFGTPIGSLVPFHQVG
jgi:hypothetical protein